MCTDFGPGAPACHNCDSPSNCYANPSANLQVRPAVTITEVGFTGDYQITRWSDSAVIDNPDGSAATWKSSGNPNHPVAYAKSATVTMFAKLGNNLFVSSTNIKIRVKNGSTVIATKDTRYPEPPLRPRALARVRHWRLPSRPQRPHLPGRSLTMVALIGRQ